MNTETVYHIPAHAAFSVSLVHGDITHLATSKQAALLVAESGIRLLIGLRVYELDTGDAVLVPPFTYAAVTNKIATFCGFRLLFPYELLSDLAPRTSFRVADGGAAFSFPTKQKRILLDAVTRLNESTLPASLSFPAVLSILEQNAIAEDVTDLDVHLPKALRQAMKYLSMFPDAPLDVEVLAARYGISSSTLLRLFRTYLDSTPRAYAKAVLTIRKTDNE